MSNKKLEDVFDEAIEQASLNCMRTKAISIGLLEIDFDRLEAYCRKKRLKKAVFLRELVLAFLENVSGKKRISTWRQKYK